MRVVALAVATLVLAACSADIGVRRATIDTGAATVTLDGGHGGGFSPPGEAEEASLLGAVTRRLSAAGTLP